jgi:alkanesulfonate monooxygenase SsuD/methylene tetrahydromethanopterin reductase-like flavin-dependent oxidoreductase (luciferase family)
MRIGLTLPQFSADAAAMVAAARRAEDAGIDAVFAYNHYPRAGRTEALDGIAMLGALAVATDRIGVGLLVARIGVVPDGVLISQLRTAARLAGKDRFVAGLGVGDKESDPEDEALGITRPPLDDRFVRLEYVANALNDEDIEVWLGGRSRRAATLSAALGVARNLWEPTAQQLTDALDESEGRAITWGAQTDITNEAGVELLATTLSDLSGRGVAAAVVAPTKAGAPDAAERVMRAKKIAGLP